MREDESGTHDAYAGLEWRMTCHSTDTELDLALKISVIFHLIKTLKNGQCLQKIA